MTTQLTNVANQASRWERWRGHRNQALASDHGWLTLTSLQWLPEKPQELDGVPGQWWTDGETAFFTAEAADSLALAPDAPQASDASDASTDTSPGQGPTPALGQYSAKLEDEQSLIWVQFGGAAGTDVQVELARRGGAYAIRTRDNNAPAFTSFTGVPVFDYTPDLVVTAQFTAFDAVQDEAISTAHPRVTAVHHAVGELSFTLPDSAGGAPGELYRLKAEAEQLGALVITFHDLTNGDSTDAWRKVVTARPRPDGTVIIDFNRAINYPSAFSDFGTCPAPVAGNSINARIEAGERRVD